MTVESHRSQRLPGWRRSRNGIEIYFGGKGPLLERQSALRHAVPRSVAPAWLQQVHSATVVDARPGDNGEGDALVTEQRRLALSVVTADCVPVLLAGDRCIAAVHAGWRGLAQSILPEAVHRMDEANSTTAWIGPAIGPCCYKVGPEVAEQVIGASGESVLREGDRGRPHLDLAQAARIQLEGCGILEIHTINVCTHCREDRLWSYRRDGAQAGRNIAAIWRA